MAGDVARVGDVDRAGDADRSSVDAYWHCDLPEYTRRVEQGAGIARDLRLVVCGLVRDCEPHLPRTFENMECTGRLFASWRGVLYENDSGDRSPAMIQEWAAEHPGFLAKSLVLGEQSWPMQRLPDRGTALARYRNQCRDLVLEHFGDFDLVLIVDTDLFGWSINGVLHSLSYWGQWDAMFSNGLRESQTGWAQYDAWAIRAETWNPKSYDEIKDDVYCVGAPLVPVWSAFGGAGLYTMDAFKAAQYEGGDCEHVPFHRQMREAGFDRMFINPSLKTVVSWREPDRSVLYRSWRRLRRYAKKALGRG